MTHLLWADTNNKTKKAHAKSRGRIDIGDWAA